MTCAPAYVLIMSANGDDVCQAACHVNVISIQTTCCLAKKSGRVGPREACLAFPWQFMYICVSHRGDHLGEQTEFMHGTMVKAPLLGRNNPQ